MKTAAIEVTYKDHMGSDLDVVNAARVSFDKESDWNTKYDEEVNLDYLVLSDKDAKLIKYLAEHNHWSPFSHCFIKFRIKAPIFVARQLQKHTVGLAWNEVSRRYVDYEPEFYFPDVWRKRSEDKKQGSGDAYDDVMWTCSAFGSVGSTVKHEVENLSSVALSVYKDMLTRGVAPEQARMVLPQNTMTEWIWSGSLYAFARVCNLRCKPDSQKETQDVANQIYNHLKQHFPVSTEYLVK